VEAVAEAGSAGGVVAGSEAGVVVLGGVAGDCPEADAGKNATDTNANATEALANARGIDTCNVLRKPSRNDVSAGATLTTPPTFR